MSRLADALFTATQQNVLGLLYSHPERSFYTKEILRSTGMGVATIKRALDRMELAGILTFKKLGNQHHYQANPDCQIYDELLAVVRKTFGIADVLRDALGPIKQSVVFAFVYGSIAKGDEKTGSDIDLMLIGHDLSYAETVDLLISVEEKLKRPTNPTIYPLADFRRKMDQKSNFLTRVMQQNKIIVMGSENDVRES